MTRKRLQLGIVGLATAVGLILGNPVRAEEADPSATIKTVWSCKTTCYFNAGKFPIEYSSCSSNSTDAKNDSWNACKEANPSLLGDLSVSDTSCENKAAPCQ